MTLRLKGCIKRRRIERLYRYNAGVPTGYAARYGAFGNRNGERSATVPHVVAAYEHVGPFPSDCRV